MFVIELIVSFNRKNVKICWREGGNGHVKKNQ